MVNCFLPYQSIILNKPTLILKDVSLQANNVIQNAHLPNSSAHPAGHHLVPPDVNLYDIQRLAVPGGRHRSRRRLLYVRLEEIRHR